MSPQRELDARTLAEVADDVERLKQGYTQDGEWTLPQIASHCGYGLSSPTPSDRSRPTADEAKMQTQIEPIFAANAMPYGLPIFPGTEPAPDAGDATVNEFVTVLRRLDKESSPFMDFGPFGPLPLAKFKDFIRIHCVHHLQMLRPTA